MKQEPVTVSDIRKIFVNHGFLNSLFCGNVQKTHTVNNATKMNNAMCPKNVMSKFRALQMANIEI